MIGQRILAVAAAALLVIAVSLAMLEPPDMPLGQAFMTDHGLLRGLESAIDRYSAHWIWSWGFVPFLLRPVWLVPAMLGIICVGLSMSLASRQAARDPHRRKRS